MLSNEFIAFILGVVEGLTEFIPVSSTGHLIIAADFLGFHGEKAKLFEIFIQLGAILAIVILYPRFFLNLIPGKSKQNSPSAFHGVNGLIKLGVAALPVFIFGFIAHGYIKEHLFNSTTVAIGLIVGSVLILFAESKNSRSKEVGSSKSEISEITIADCLKIGLFQCLALWPGVSRSGATIIGGLQIGLERKLAAEFSFLLAVPVLTAAVLYDVYKNYKLITIDDCSMFGIGFFTSLIVALFAVKFFLSYIKTSNFKLFAYYRIVLAVVVLLLMN